MITYMLRQYLAKHPNIKAVPVKSGCNWKEGHKYWSGYWSTPYEVLKVNRHSPIWGTTVTVKDAEGIRTHATALDSRYDYELIMEG